MNRFNLEQLRKSSFIAALVILVAIVWNSSTPSKSVLSQGDNSGKSSSAPGQYVDNYGRSKKLEVSPTPQASDPLNIFATETPKPSEHETSADPSPTFAPTPVPPPITKIIPVIPVQTARTQTETPVKIEVRTDDRRESVNLSEPGTSLKVERINGAITIKARRADGQEIKLNRDEVVDIQSSFLPESITETAEVENINDKLYSLRYGDTIAETYIPLSAILGDVSANTNFGEKDIAFFPSDAVKTLIDKKIITGTKDVALVLNENGEVKALNRKVRLITYGRELAYEIEGVKKEYFLGFSLFPMDINKRITISEESEEVLDINQGLKEKIKDLFSY